MAEITKWTLFPNLFTSWKHQTRNIGISKSSVLRKTTPTFWCLEGTPKWTVRVVSVVPSLILSQDKIKFRGQRRLVDIRNTKFILLVLQRWWKSIDYTKQTLQVLSSGIQQINIAVVDPGVCILIGSARIETNKQNWHKAASEGYLMISSYSCTALSA